MTHPIFERVLQDLGHEAHHAENAITSLFHHTSTTSNYTPASASTPAKGNPVSLADDIKEDFTEGIDYVKGFADRLSTAAPQVLTKLQQYANSPVVAALEQAGAALDPAAEEVIAGWITDLAHLKVTAAAPAAPAAPATPAPAPSAPAVPAAPAKPAS